MQAAASFARVSADVERQYLRALFEACDGDLERMAHELLGPKRRGAPGPPAPQPAGPAAARPAKNARDVRPRRPSCSRCCWPPDAGRDRRRDGRIDPGRTAARTAHAAARRRHAVGARAAARTAHAQAMARLRAGNLEEAAALFAARRRAGSGQRRLRDRSRLRARAARPARRGRGGSCAARSRRIRIASTPTSTSPDLRRRSGALGAARRDRRVPREGARRAQGRSARGASTWCSASPTSSARSGARRRRARASSRCWPSTPTRRCRARSASACSICSTRIALDERAHALEDWPRAARSPRADAAQADAAARALDTGHANEALRDRRRRWSQRYPTWPRGAGAAGARARGAGPRRRGRARSGDRRQPRPVRRAGLAHAGQAAGPARRRAGGRARRRGAAQRADAGAGLDRPARAARPARAPARRRQARGEPRPRDRAVGHARALYQEAEEWIDVGDPVGLGRDLLEQALADSPGFVAAAVSSYALSGRCRPRRSTRCRTTGPACGRWPRACASWAASDRPARSPAARTTSTRW